ncbi:MAG: cation transporter [Proteobacteria bacterium]|nr:cation transporter [Pseudomonadota bacterium]MBU1716316.1 cation transporter [Pseudomonadota bacterium]
MPTIKITGMSCNHCVASVTKTLNEIVGIKNVQVDLKQGQATYDEEKPVSIETIRAAISAIGFGVE